MSDRLLVGTRKGLMTLARRGDGWAIARTDFAGIPVSAVLHDRRDAASQDGVLYAALNHGHFGAKLHSSDDGGRNWRELPAPAFRADAIDDPTLSQIWTLEAGGASQPGRLWIGALPAGLFRSDDGGERWELTRALWDVPERAKWMGGGYDEAGIHTVSPDPRDPRRVFVAISCGGVWDTADDGQSWTLRGDGMVAPYMPPEQAGMREIQDPHRVARCPAAPDVMWMQHHAGVYRSLDTGATWTRLMPPGDDFGFAVAAHPSDAQTAWLVPAMKDELRMPRDGALCVTRTRDGGRTWQAFRQGLPTRLALGATTGGLWVSENAGEAWTLLNAHLPPIYAVRFA